MFGQRGAETLQQEKQRLLDCLPPRATVFDPSATEDDHLGREALLAYLSRKLIVPLRERLTGKQALIISPDGPLGLVAFDVLPFGDKRLIESFQVSQVQSLGEVLYHPGRAYECCRTDCPELCRADYFLMPPFARFGSVNDEAGLPVNRVLACEGISSVLLARSGRGVLPGSDVVLSAAGAILTHRPSAGVRSLEHPEEGPHPSSLPISFNSSTRSKSSTVV